MKRIVALALCLVMIVGLMTGCQKPMDAKTLVQKMDEAVKNVDSYAMNMDMELEIEIAITGMTLSMGINMDMDMKAMADMSKSYMDMTMAVNVLGQSEETKAETYMAMEDGAMVSYAYSEDEDLWVKTTTNEMGDLIEQLKQTTVSTDFSQFTEEQMTLAEEKETKNGKECYVLTITADGTSIEDAFRVGMESAMDAMTEEDEAMLEQMDFSALQYSTVYYVDAETFAPVEMTMELTGFGEMMTKLFSEIMGEAMMGTDEEIEMSVDIPTCKLVVTDMVYGGVDVPAVPQEAIDNAVDADDMEDYENYEDDEYYDPVENPPQADGSYLLDMEGDTVRIVLPEGWNCEMSDSQMLIACTDDYSGYVRYTLYWGEDVETALENFQSLVDFAKEAEYYLSHTEPVEMGGFTVVELVNNTGVTDYYAYMAVESGLLEVAVTVDSDDGEIMNTLLDNIKVNEG